MSGAETKAEFFAVAEMGEGGAGGAHEKRCAYERWAQPCLAELLGTGLFVFVGCASVIGSAGTAGVLQPAVAHGLALGVLIMVFGQISSYDAALGGALQPSTGDLGKTTLAEATLTLILTTVVCMGAVNGRTRSPWAPFCIGLAVTANILAGGVVSGACMNPARAFGPAVAANHWNHHWIYWVGPVCGALLTVGFIRLLFGDRKTRVVLK